MRLEPPESLPLSTRWWRLRPFVPEDAETLRALGAEGSSARWLPLHVYDSLADARAAVPEPAAWCRSPGEPRRAAFVLGIEATGMGRLIGHVGFCALGAEALGRAGGFQVDVAVGGKGGPRGRGLAHLACAGHYHDRKAAGSPLQGRDQQAVKSPCTLEA